MPRLRVVLEDAQTLAVAAATTSVFDVDRLIAELGPEEPDPAAASTGQDWSWDDPLPDFDLFERDSAVVRPAPSDPLEQRIAARAADSPENDPIPLLPPLSTPRERRMIGLRLRATCLWRHGLTQEEIARHFNTHRQPTWRDLHWSQGLVS